MIEVEINKEWKFWLYVFFQIVTTLMVLFLVCLIGYFIFFNNSIAYKELSKSCDKMFGEGNWSISDTRIRTNWYSIGQEFTCVQNESEIYLNELKKEQMSEND